MKVNAKYVVFSAIAMASLYVLYHNERFVVQPTNPIWQHYEPFKWWLLPHAIFGTPATAIYQVTSRHGTVVCRRSVRSRPAGCIYTVLPGADGSTAFVYDF